ncbi:hypothetical protein C1I97_29725, partial [Streptomyces sp. NTH33]
MRATVPGRRSGLARPATSIHSRVIRSPTRERTSGQRGANGVDGAAPGASEESRQAFAEAAQIRRALHAKRTGTVPED